MLEQFLFIGLPYLAVTLLVVGSIYRYRVQRFSYSSLSSQFLEDRKLRWGSFAWHIGILVVLLGHVIPFLLPGMWASLTANSAFLYSVEALGLGASLLALFGLGVLLVRRLTSRWLQEVTSVMDLILLGALLIQVMTGIGVALGYRWGAGWAPGTVTPYLWSLAVLQPDIGYVSELPGFVRLHIAGAWIIFGLLPFSRLVHIFSLPLEYLVRPPQRVVWANPRRQRATVVEARQGRRHFLKGAVGAGSALSLLTVGFLDKIVSYFQGPDLTVDEEAELLRTRLVRLRQTAEERELELERLRSPYIRVARLADLDPKRGHYFIDYQMRPALAFLGADGLPILISAKCTHLGCTVGSTVDDQGRILCPCHISYFDIRTGEPNAGAPAKTPLPPVGWILMDGGGRVLSSRGPDGVAHGNATAEELASAWVCIAKKHEDGRIG